MLDSLKAVIAQRQSITATAHRPWTLPAGPWLVAQSWVELLFAHWPVTYDELRRFVPPQLELDAFEGRCWLGVVPFRMRTVRFRDCPPVLGTSQFPEVNVRTYVVAQGRPGVFFLSLDAQNPLAVQLGRRLFDLPYLRARVSMRATEAGVTVDSRRTEQGWPAATLLAEYRPDGPPGLSAPGTLEHWLTERYCFYTFTRARGLRRTDVHHLPWQLQTAVADLRRNSLLDPFAIRLSGEPLLHYSQAQHVVAWAPADAPRPRRRASARA